MDSSDSGGNIAPVLDAAPLTRGLQIRPPPPPGKSAGGVWRRERGSGARRGLGEVRVGVGKGEEGQGRAWGAKKEEKRDYFDQF